MVEPVIDTVCEEEDDEGNPFVVYDVPDTQRRFLDAIEGT